MFFSCSIFEKVQVGIKKFLSNFYLHASILRCGTSGTPCIDVPIFLPSSQMWWFHFNSWFIWSERNLVDSDIQYFVYFNEICFDGIIPEFDETKLHHDSAHCRTSPGNYFHFGHKFFSISRWISLHNSLCSYCLHNDLKIINMKNKEYSSSYATLWYSQPYIQFVWFQYPTIYVHFNKFTPSIALWLVPF